MSSGRPNRPSRTNRRKLNPAFAAAHGLQAERPVFRNTALSAEQAQMPTCPPPSVGRSAGDATALPGRKRFEHSLKVARSTGRLNLSDCGLRAPLPDTVFDLRAGLTVDLSLDREDDVNPWECRGEETLTLVDFSDNDLSSQSSSNGMDGDDGNLDERIERFAAAQTLRCRRCHLRSIPWQAIGGLDCLTLLDLSGNSIRAVPLHFLPMTLRELDLSSNKITSLCSFEEMESSGGENEGGVNIVLPNLIRLDVTNNELTEFPALLRFGNVQTLRFGANRVAKIPDELIEQSSRSLAALEGPKNKLRTVPDLSGCRSLRIVDFCDNHLQDMPMIHSSLVRLALTNNEITSINTLFDDVEARRSEFFRSDLSELRLRQNKLAELNDEVLTYLTNLTLLDLGENELRDLPCVLGYLPKLRRIPLDRNPLRAIRLSLAEDTDALKKSLRKRGPSPPGPGYIAAENGLSGDPEQQSEVERAEAKGTVNASMVGSHTLDLSNKELSELPNQIINELQAFSGPREISGNGPVTVGSQVKALRLCHNNLHSLSDEWIGVLPNLTKLDAGHNKLKSLPSNLHEVPLVAIELSRNQLTSDAIEASAICRVSKDMLRMAQSLTHLNLSSNCIKWIPAGLFDLPVLSTLILSHNKINCLASEDHGGGWRPGLPALENLDLSSNQISDLGDLPVILGGCCPKLRSLMLNNNELRSIPPALGLIQSLNAIDLRGNPQRSIRLAVLDRSCGAILSYLRSRMSPPELEAARQQQVGYSKEVVQLETSGKEEVDDGSRIASCYTSKKAEVRAASAEGNSDTPLTSPLVEELRLQIDDLTMQLNNVHLTEATKYAMKKKLAMQKAKLIREERRLRAAPGSNTK